MNNVIQSMLAQYSCRGQDEYINALREILQSLALLGLWRAKFFEHAAFYGGSALRLLYNLDRFSEDLDFSLLTPDPTFSLNRFGQALIEELTSFGFHVEFEPRVKRSGSPIDSAFLKTNSYKQLIHIGADERLLDDLHINKKLKIKLEVDIDPPPLFKTEVKYILRPIPYSVKVYKPEYLFAGKIHAILCRRWKNRVKGRDWYDFVWYASNYPKFSIRHLEERMRQTNDYQSKGALSQMDLMNRFQKVIDRLDIEGAKQDVRPFLRDPRSLDIWSLDFFHHILNQIKSV